MTNFPGIVNRVAEAVTKRIVTLRYYQSEIEDGIYHHWAAGHPNVLAVAPTGGGKTRIFCSILSKHQGAAVAIAHRQEIVAQISLTLNSFGIRHRLICPPDVRKMIIGRHLKEHKVTFYDASAMIGAGGVDTLVSMDRRPELHTWRDSVTLWVQDEAHHVLKENKWGKAAQLFPNAKNGLGVTATPERPDGQGLGSHCGGLFDAMVVGPGMRVLINDGYLCPYKVWTIPHDVDYSRVDVGPKGEFVHAKLIAAEDCDKKLVGRVVDTYLKLAPNTRAVCFMSNIKKAQETAEQFRACGVPSIAVDGKTHIDTRADAMEDLATGKIKVLVNVGVVGEGTDIPDVETVILGTRTASFVLFSQWWGRGSRLVLSDEAKQGYDQLDSAGRRARIAASEKPFYRVIDHGGNVIHHNGPPDLRTAPWSLDARQRKNSALSEAIPYRVCPNYMVLDGMDWETARALGFSDSDLRGAGLARPAPNDWSCATPYAAIHRCCPECGYMPMPARRSAPQEVDGDLQLLDADALAALVAASQHARRSPADVEADMLAKRLAPIKAAGHANRQREKLAAHNELDRAIGLFGGVYHHRYGETDSQIQRRFYLSFGIDVESAKALDRAAALKLAERIDSAVTSA